MRQGENPARDKILTGSGVQHRVILPLHIPEGNAYYAESLEIFELSLESLRRNSVYEIAITVVANGCAAEVEARLMELRSKGLISELVVTGAIGKLNSILKGLRASHEELVTISDADVFFCAGWDEAVLQVFDAFPKAAAVSPTPVFRTHNRLTSNIWFDYLFSRKLRFKPVANTEALTRFAKSIGWSRLDEKWKDTIMTLEAGNGHLAIVGNSHFCVTYLRDCLYNIPREGSKYKLGGDSELIYLDLPPVKCDGYRLATYENFAYHMGNSLEDWMRDLKSQSPVEKKTEFPYRFNPMKPKPLAFGLKFKLFRKFMQFSVFKRWFYKRKGLTKEQMKNFAV